MKKPGKENVYVLTKADRDRIEAAMGLMRLIIRELLDIRRTRVSHELHTPAALHELAEEVDRLREEQLRFCGL